MHINKCKIISIYCFLGQPGTPGLPGKFLLLLY